MQILRPFFAQCYRSGGRTIGNRLQARDFSASSSLSNNNNINDSKRALYMKRFVIGTVTSVGLTLAVGSVAIFAYFRSELRRADEESKRYNEELKLLANAEFTQQVSNAE